MSLDNFRALKEKRDELVIVATDLAMVATPWGNDMPSQIVSSDGTLTPLPEGWQSFGEVAKDAARRSPPSASSTTSSVTAPWLPAAVSRTPRA